VLAIVATLTVAPQPATSAPVAQADPRDPLTAARFALVVDGVEIAVFQSLVSLESELDPVATLRDGRRPAPQTSTSSLPPHVTLRRGMTNSLELWAWHQAAVDGRLDVARKNATLIMYNTEGKPVVRLFLARAWPSSLEISTEQAGSSQVLYEVVTLVCDELERVSPN
jgi:phage tail-like protein